MPARVVGRVVELLQDNFGMEEGRLLPVASTHEQQKK